jgi:uncharacterized protein
MIVRQLWRYPVKSLGGEQLEGCAVAENGLEGDRGWGLVDNATGNVLTARREPALLFASARLVGPDEVEIVLPDGSVTTDSGSLSAWLGHPVTLRRAGAEGGTYENPRDVENDADWVAWQGPGYAWHDSGDCRLSLVSTATIGHWDVRRFRPNIVLEGAGEDDLVGHRMTMGSATLDITKRITRCVMVSRPQPDLDRDLDVLRAINRARDGRLSVGALVAEPGHIALGDAFT